MNDPIISLNLILVLFTYPYHKIITGLDYDYESWEISWCFFLYFHVCLSLYYIWIAQHYVITVDRILARKFRWCADHVRTQSIRNVIWISGNLKNSKEIYPDLCSLFLYVLMGSIHDTNNEIRYLLFCMTLDGCNRESLDLFEFSYNITR